MPYFKDTTNNLYFLDSAEFINVLPNGCVEITDEEAQVLAATNKSQDLVQAYEIAVQSFMDSKAQSFGYDDIKSAVTYAEEPAVLKFQTEGKAFRAWRSLCWAYCYEQLDKVQSNQRTVPTVEELVVELPTFNLEV